jgi:citrate synthase
VLAILVALPKIAGYILERKYGSRVSVDHDEESYSYSASVTREIICRLKGCSFDVCGDAQEFINLYLVLHSDHGGGNASAHTSRLVGSTQADPFLTLSASLLALSGPLHGGANGDALQWLRRLQRHVEQRQRHTDDTTSVRSYTKQWLREGNKVPGFGHAVLGRIDPRVEALLSFANAHKRTFSPKGLAFLRMALPAVSSVLKEGGKVRAPFPNVDAASGILLDSILCGSKGGGEEGREIESEMVVDAGLLLFALGRSLGTLTHLVLDRALGVPLERPNSLTLEQLRLRAKL